MISCGFLDFTENQHRKMFSPARLTLAEPVETCFGGHVELAKVNLDKLFWDSISDSVKSRNSVEIMF